jgi:hypothetical protein
MKRHLFLHVICLIALFFAGGCATLTQPQPDTNTLTQLEKRGGSGIPVSQALELKSKLGQLIYINIDGRGYRGGLAVNPVYLDLIRDLQVGGVLAHYNTMDYKAIEKTNRRIYSLTNVPPFIGIDYLKIKRLPGAAKKGRPRKNYLLLGNGFKRGCLTTYSRLDEAEFDTIIGLHAFLLKSLGINQVLGPTVDNSVECEDLRHRAVILFHSYDKFRLLPTLKHFPYLPLPHDLHRTSPDTKLPVAEVIKRISDFKALHSFARCIMTTHLYNSLVDAGNIATFSSKWVNLLKTSLDYNDLIMSDGLFMIKSYKHHPTDCASLFFKDLTVPPHVHPVSIFAVRAICAGHDIIILEGNDRDTYRVFYDLLFFACQQNITGERLRRRINDAYRKIINAKLGLKEVLRPTAAPLSGSFIREAIGLCAGLEDRLL